MSLELKPCPHCGSGDVRLCRISRRPYCGECNHWARVNFTGTIEDSVAEWNRRSTAAWEMPTVQDRFAQVQYEFEELSEKFVQLGQAMIEMGERMQHFRAVLEKKNEFSH